MKIIILLALLFSSPLYAILDDINDEIDGIVTNLENEKTIIQDGLSLGSRKKTLEKIYDQKFEQIRDLQEIKKHLTLYVKELKDQINSDNSNREYACTLSVRRIEFYGFSTNKEIAQKKAIHNCMQELSPRHCSLSASRGMKCIK